MFDRTTLPYGVFSIGGGERRIGVAVDDGVLDLAEHLDSRFATDSLNAFLAEGPQSWAEVRRQVQGLVDRPLLQDV